MLGRQTHRWSPKSTFPTALPPTDPSGVSWGEAAWHSTRGHQEAREGAPPPRAGTQPQDQGSSFVLDKENPLTSREFKVVFVRDQLEG